MSNCAPSPPLGALQAAEAAARRLLPRGARVLVACSGGPDSQALLDMLSLLRPALGLDCLWAAGIDHQLRPEAAQELVWAQSLAERHGVRFFTRSVRVAPQRNVLAAARQARYAALRALAKRLGATHLALGHTATDQVETLILNLCRGSGLQGAGAIRARRGPIVRPLLHIGRATILSWLAQRNIGFAQDPSNQDPRRARAQLRACVLPALRALNPEFEAHIGAFCRDAQREEAWLKRQAHRRLAQSLGPAESLDADAVLALGAPLRQRVLMLWLRHVGATPTRRAVHRVMQLLTGRAHGACGPAGTSVAGANVVLERGRLWRGTARPRRTPTGNLDGNPVAARPQSTPRLVQDRIPLAIPSCTPMPAARQLTVKIQEVRHAAFAAKSASMVQHSAEAGAQTVAFDADRLHFGLALRPWQQGDKLRPFGLEGRIKVGDLFTNHKVPRALRSGWPLLLCGDDILWVVGLRRSAHAPVTATTRRIVMLKVEDTRREAQNEASPA